MEIIYPTACGVDVHKSFIVAVICICESVKPKYIKKRFSTFNNQLIQFWEQLIEKNCHNVCMESTGKYYIPVYNTLEGHISNVVVANPKWVKAIKDEKDDNKNVKWIADLFLFGIVRSSYIPEKDIRILKEFTRYQYKLVNIRSSEKNSFQNVLMVAGYENYIQLLCSIPGIDRKSAIILIAELGIDVFQWSNSCKLVAWV